MRKGLILLLAVLLCALLFVSCSQDKNRAVIYFNSNGGYGHMNPQPVTKDKETNLNANEFARTGWHFDHWSERADGTGKRYDDGASIKVQQDTTLYAQWEANTYTVKFEPGEGSGTMADQEFIYHTSKALEKNTFVSPEPSNLYFLYWKVKDEDKHYMDQEWVYNLTAEDGGVVTLVAQWGEGFEYRKKVPNWKESLQDYVYIDCRVDKSKLTILDDSFTELTDGWYAITTNITVDDRIAVRGDVHLILCDGTTLTANKGIDVSNGDKLTIYDQGIDNNAEIGKIIIHGIDNGLAGIGGGTKEKSSGSITIHGGNLDIRLTERGGAGIGGNNEASNGEIRILGGVLHVEGGGYAAAIGSGSASDSGIIEIFGGKVEAVGTLGAGIGAAISGRGGTFLIGGDAEIDAEGGIPLEIGGGGEASAGIGGSNENFGGTIIIYGCKRINAKGGLRPEFDYGPEIKGAGIGGGNIDNKNLNGTLKYDSDKVKIEVSSDGEKWEAYNGEKRKQYMRVLPVTVE